MKKYSAELSVGIFVFVSLLCVAYLTIRLGKMDIFTDKGYQIVAKFTSITGLRNGAAVEIGGVGVGKVTNIVLDDKFNAAVTMRIRDGLHLSEDTGAAVKTSGLIGDKYVSLSPGGSEKMLGNGDELSQTQDAIDLERLISNYVFGSMK